MVFCMVIREALGINTHALWQSAILLDTVPLWKQLTCNSDDGREGTVASNDNSLTRLGQVLQKEPFRLPLVGSVGCVYLIQNLRSRLLNFAILFGIAPNGCAG